MLVPLLVTSATWPPEERPWSALSPAVVTRNSSMESSVERTAPVKALPVALGIVVDAVEGDVGLIAAAAVDGAVAGVDVVVDVGADEGGAGLEAEDACGIAAFKGQGQESVGVEGVAERGVGGVDRGDPPDSVTVMVSATEPSSSLMLSFCGVETRASTLSVTAVRKPVGFDADDVGAGLQGEKLEAALLVGVALRG